MDGEVVRRFARANAEIAIAVAARDNDEPAQPATTAPPTATASTGAPTTTLPSAPTTLPSAPTMELRGADGNPDAVEVFGVISAAYEAFNTGDTLAFGILRSAPDLEFEPGSPDVEYAASLKTVGARYTDVSCDYRGFVDIEAAGSDSSTEPVAGHSFECFVTKIDPFTIAAGIDFVDGHSWSVADGKVLEAFTGSDSQELLQRFMRELATWIRNEHPESEYTPIRFWNYPVAGDIPAALELVDEFVAADDFWPLTGT